MHLVHDCRRPRHQSNRKEQTANVEAKPESVYLRVNQNEGIEAAC
jgi:hypothetical protein